MWNMNKNWALVSALPLLVLTACEEEAPAVVASETGGEAAGEILGGTISDDMIPLEELTSTSPPAERETTTTITTTSNGTQTSVETTVTSSADQDAPAPAPPPEPPAPTSETG